jgi:hypothetical protein
LAFGSAECDDPARFIVVASPLVDHLHSVLNHSYIRGSLHLAHDIVALAEKGEPLAQHGLVLILQVTPLGYTVFFFKRGGCESARGILAREDCVFVRVSGVHLAFVGSGRGAWCAGDREFAAFHI